MDRDLVVSSSCLICTRDGKLIANLVPQKPPWSGGIPLGDATAYAELFAKAPQMEDICKRLATLIPAQRESELDAADFVDAAGNTFALVLEARKVLGVEPIPEFEEEEQLET